MEPQCRQPGTPNLAAAPLGGPYRGLTQPSLALQSGARLPPQHAVGSPPCLPGRAVGESTQRPTCSPPPPPPPPGHLSPDWAGDLYSLLGLAKGDPRSPNSGSSARVGTQTRMRAKYILSDFCHHSLDQSPVCPVIVPWVVEVSWALRPSLQTQPLGKGLGTQGLLCALLSDPCAAAAGCACEGPPALGLLWARGAGTAQVSAEARGPPLRWPS